MTRKLVKLDQYRSMDKIPDEIVGALENVLQMAKEGKVVEAIFSFTYDMGTEVHPTDMAMWRNDGRLDSIHSQCHVMANQALKALTEGE